MTEIQNVSDTAIWVAYYRALESERPDALFRDPLAKKLVGERGKIIADSSKKIAGYTQSTVVIRTYIIDRLIEKLAAEGIDTVINLGAGLDTRPYRMNLPNLRWVEVDYPHMIEYKQRILSGEKPKMKLEQVAMDLANRQERRAFLSKIGNETRKALVLTEGVIIYLDEAEVASLAEDLRQQPTFAFWIAEYIAPSLYKYFQNPRRMKHLKNAPFKLYPKDWFGFFSTHGWQKKEISYLWEEGTRIGRPVRTPWWMYLIKPIIPKKVAAEIPRQFGYVIFEPNERTKQ